MATQTTNLHLTKPAYSDTADIQVINNNMDTIDSAIKETYDVDSGVAVVINGNTAPKNIAAGTYLFIKNHNLLATGGYHATTAIASGASITSSNVTQDTNGIVNGLFSTLDSKKPNTIVTDTNDTWATLYPQLSALSVSSPTALIYITGSLVSELTNGLYTASAYGIAERVSSTYFRYFLMYGSATVTTINQTNASASSVGDTVITDATPKMNTVTGTTRQEVLDSIDSFARTGLTCLNIAAAQAQLIGLPSAVYMAYCISSSQSYRIIMAINRLASSVYLLAKISDTWGTTWSEVTMMDSSYVTRNDMSVVRLDNVSLLDTSIKPGHYYITNASDTPTSTVTGFLDIKARGDAETTIREVVWRPYSVSNYFTNYLPNSSVWEGWRCSFNYASFSQAANTTMSYNLPNSTRGRITLISSSVESNALVIFYVTGSGTVVYNAVYKGENVTFSRSTNTLTIALATTGATIYGEIFDGHTITQNT